MKKKSHNLSIFLLKSNIVSSEEALKNSDAVKQCDVPINGHVAPLFFKQTPANTPAWVRLFRPHIGASLDSLRNSGSAAVLLVEKSSRLFAITFGYGKSLLKPDCYEENFGLKVVLNLVDPEKLRSIDAQSLDAVPVQVRSQAGTATSLSEFGFDVERDLIYAATGQPKEAEFGKQITGKDSIKLSVPIDLGELGGLLDKLLTKYTEDTYKENFGWIDNLSEVRDHIFLARLDTAFGEKISSKDFNRTWLALPDIIEWPDFLGFKYQQAKRGGLLDDIDWLSYLEFVGDKSPHTPETFRKHRVLCISASSEMPVHEWPVYKCAYCELELDGGTYALNNGKWYRVDEDFLGNLNKVIEAIPASAITLPDYEDKTEGEYNERVYEGDKNYFALMDKKNISYGGGSSKIEFCDLFTKDQHLIHVKRYGGSSVLSHLFAQGLVSTRLLLADADFRVEVNKKLPISHKLKNPNKKPNPSDFEVVYAIASKSPAAQFKLPLFSKINLRNAYRQLELLSVRTTIAIVTAKDVDTEVLEVE